MVALNSLNGTPATSDSWLLKDVLRDQWGFKGITAPLPASSPALYGGI
nr:glycoside hydrolase family 3 N-terminal domain-containing protein [Escherichia coli]